MGSLTVNGLQSMMAVLSTVNIDDASEKNVEKAAQHLESEIKARAPVDTGHLRSSYAHKTETTGSGVTAFVGTDVPYAIHQEYGTYKMAAQPHVRPALDANRQTLFEMMAHQTLEDTFQS